MSSPAAAQLRKLLNGSGPLVVPFAYDAFSARLIEDAGFQAVGVNGSAVSASLLAAPDMGLLSREEMVGQAGRIARAVPALPVIADAETGYGDLLRSQRPSANSRTRGYPPSSWRINKTPSDADILRGGSWSLQTRCWRN